MLQPPQTPVEMQWTAETLQVLDTCQRIHKRAEELYQYLSGVHQAHRELAQMWGVLAIDKCNHADTFKMAKRLKGQAISEVYLSAEAAATIHNKMKAIPLSATHPPPSELEALRFVVKMEEKLNVVHFCHVVRFFNEQDLALMTSSLKSSGTILHLLTEQYLNMTLFP